jgi:protein-arginine kinase activator protein McsA
VPICGECGRPASLECERDGETTIRCPRCVDRQMAGFGVGAMIVAFQGRRRASVQTCPHCGWNQEDLEGMGLAGCPLCYEAFDRSVWSRFGIVPAPTAGA